MRNDNLSLSENLLPETNKKLKNNLQHNGISMDWIVTWNDLISDRTPLKDKILRSLCDIYHHDVSCLPYDVPECSEDWIGSVA